MGAESVGWEEAGPRPRVTLQAGGTKAPSPQGGQLFRRRREISPGAPAKGFAGSFFIERITMNVYFTSVLSLSFVAFTGSKALADENPSTPLPGESAPSALVVAVEASEPTIHRALPVRPLLSRFAEQEAIQRYGEGALGVAGGGVLLGSAFAVGPHDKTWAYGLGISGGVAALASVVRLLVPSELESLDQSGQGLSEQQLRERWGEFARARRTERRVGAVLEGLLGATSVVLGGLVLEHELGKLDGDARRALGSALVASGALGIVQAGVHWFMPSPLEVGYGLVESRPTFALGAAPTTSGFAVAVTGAF